MVIDKKMEKKIEGIVLTTYNKYKKFVDYNNLPKFKIEYVKDVPYKMEVVCSESPIPLNIDASKFNDCDFDFFKTLYHEFTHIYDYEILFKRNKDREFFLSLYSEFHAAQIELLYLLKEKSLYQCKYSTIHNKIATSDKAFNILKFLLNEKKNTACECRDKFLSNSNPYTLHYFLNTTANYAGLISMLPKNMSNLYELIFLKDEMEEFPKIIEVFSNDVINDEIFNKSLTLIKKQLDKLLRLTI